MSDAGFFILMWVSIFVMIVLPITTWLVHLEKRIAELERRKKERDKL